MPSVWPPDLADHLGNFSKSSSRQRAIRRVAGGMDGRLLVNPGAGAYHALLGTKFRVGGRSVLDVRSHLWTGISFRVAHGSGNQGKDVRGDWTILAWGISSSQCITIMTKDIRLPL
jgi:hypothetical protein